MVKHKLSLILTTLAFSTFDILFSLVGIWFHGNSLSFQQFSNAFAESYDVNKSVSDLFIFSLLRMLFLFVGCFILVFKREPYIIVRSVNFAFILCFVFCVFSIVKIQNNNFVLYPLQYIGNIFLIFSNVFFSVLAYKIWLKFIQNAREFDSIYRQLQQKDEEKGTFIKPSSGGLMPSSDQQYRLIPSNTNEELSLVLKEFLEKIIKVKIDEANEQINKETSKTINFSKERLKELLDMTNEEFELLQQELNITKLELEKCQKERIDDLQRYTIMNTDLSVRSLNIELQKQIEIVKRLSGILSHVVPMLPQEHQGSAVAAIERAKNIKPEEIEHMLNINMQEQQQLAAFNPSTITEETGDEQKLSTLQEELTNTKIELEKCQKERDDLLDKLKTISVKLRTLRENTCSSTSLSSDSSSSDSSTSSLDDIDDSKDNVNPTTLMETNEESSDDNSMPVDPIADKSEDLPKNMRRIGDLPHGDVVCTVVFTKDKQRVFTGGKGAVKMWDITERLFNSSAANASNDTSSGDDIGGSIETASNGGGRAASTEQWLPIATFQCLKDSYIRSIKLFPDASTLIVGGEARQLCILDVERGEIKQTFDCEAEACYALAISQDCKTCFSCCSNGVVNVWDLQSGERIVQLTGHNDGASCVDISGDGQKLWTGGLDNTVRCWDIGARQEIDNQTLESQIFSLGCCPTDDWVAVGLEDQNVQVLNSTTMGEKYLLTGHQSCVLSLKFANSGKWFVSTGKDNVVNCWRTPYGYKLVKSKEQSSVLSCDISEDDRFLLTGSGDKKASLYELSF